MFKFKIYYRKGSENAYANIISRREDYIKKEQESSV
jgi:hypothetical protein